jgi:hypothetical protein
MAARGGCGGAADAFRDVPRRRRGSERQESVPPGPCSRTKERRERRLPCRGASTARARSRWQLAAVAAAQPTPSGMRPAVGGDPSGRIPLLRNPARGPKKMHRVGLAVVQFTRSTFAEAIAGRESLQPSALRARCTRKSNLSFRHCQARRSEIVANTDKTSISENSRRSMCFLHRHSTQKCTETGAPSSGFPTDLRRSVCLSESHQPQALRPRCNQETTVSRHRRQAGANCNSRSLRIFLYNAHILA